MSTVIALSEAARGLVENFCNILSGNKVSVGNGPTTDRGCRNMIENNSSQVADRITYSGGKAGLAGL